MLSSPQKLARKLRRERLRRGLSQAAAARRCSVSPSWLSQVENGHRTPSRRLAEQLEVVYQAKPGAFTTKYRFPPRGRRAASPEMGVALRSILNAVSVKSQREAPVVGPAVPNPHRWSGWRGTVEDPLWPVALHLGAEARHEVELLEARRAGDDAFWRLLNGLPYDSWTEKRMAVKLGLAHGELVRVAPRRLGACARVVDARTGHDNRHRPLPAMVVGCQGISAALWFQCPVRGATTTWKLDALVVVAVGGQRLTVNVEADGPDHEAWRDWRREQDLGLPTLRYTAAVVNARGFVRRLFSDLRRLVQTIP